MALLDPIETNDALLPDVFRRWFASRGWTPRAHQLELLAKAQDRVAAKYIQTQKAKGTPVKVTAVAVPGPKK